MLTETSFKTALNKVQLNHRVRTFQVVKRLADATLEVREITDLQIFEEKDWHDETSPKYVKAYYHVKIRFPTTAQLTAAQAFALLREKFEPFGWIIRGSQTLDHHTFSILKFHNTVARSALPYARFTSHLEEK